MKRLLLAASLVAAPMMSVHAQDLPCENIKQVGQELPFPSDAVRLGLTEGDAVVEFDIGVDGQRINRAVMSSSNSVFANAALDAVARLTCKKRDANLHMRLAFRFNKSLLNTPVDRQISRSGDARLDCNCVCGIPDGYGLSSAYPQRARDLHFRSGYVKVQMRLTKDLLITDVRTLDATHEVFAEAAVLAASQIKCHGIGRLNDVQVTVPFNFDVE